MEFNKQTYHNMVFAFDVEVFSNMYFLENSLQEDDLVKILILLNKFYPSFTYNKGTLDITCSKGMKWEDIILNGHSLKTNTYFDLCFNIPIFVQNGNQIESIYTTENGIGITVEKDERFGFVFILNIYPNVYLNTNYYGVFDENKRSWNKVSTNQTLAAIENRKVLTIFLKELEVLLKVEINHYESLFFDKIFIHKYGFYDDVVFKNKIS